MNIAFEKIQHLIPCKYCQKFRVDCEFIIVSSNTNKMIFLNPTASSIFLLCDGKKSIRDICEKVLTEYDVPLELLQDDLVRIIRDFQWNNIIELLYPVNSSV